MPTHSSCAPNMGGAQALVWDDTAVRGWLWSDGEFHEGQLILCGERSALSRVPGPSFSSSRHTAPWLPGCLQKWKLVRSGYYCFRGWQPANPYMKWQLPLSSRNKHFTTHLGAPDPSANISSSGRQVEGKLPGTAQGKPSAVTEGWETHCMKKLCVGMIPTFTSLLSVQAFLLPCCQPIWNDSPQRDEAASCEHISSCYLMVMHWGC